jgi:hypothetical protein
MDKRTAEHIAQMTNEQLIERELIPTWQPLAAIAYRTGLPVRTCESILVKMYNEGKVKCSRVRIDGHNLVHLFKRFEMQVILGVRLPMDVETHVESEDFQLKKYYTKRNRKRVGV